MAERDVFLKRIESDFLKISGVKGFAVVSSDGAILASNTNGVINSEDLGGIIGFSSGMGTQIDSEMKLGKVQNIVIEGPDYNIISIPSGQLTIGIYASKNASVDMIKNEVKEAAQKLSELI